MFEPTISATRSSLTLHTAAVLALTVFSTAFAASPPIDCRKAKSPADREICGSSEFLAMDREIAALYDRGMAQFFGDDRHKLVLSQQSFIHQRTGCAWAAHHSAHPGVAIEECVRNAMETRVRSLRVVVDHGRFQGIGCGTREWTGSKIRSDAVGRRIKRSVPKLLASKTCADDDAARVERRT